MMAGSGEGTRAVADCDPLGQVRQHKLSLFRKGWEKLEQAVPGNVRVVPQNAIRDDLIRDYEVMQGMMFGEAPEFDWIIEQLSELESTINDDA